MAILELLKHWNDREAIQARVEQEGFNVHRIYQDEVRAFGLREELDCSDLNKYWDESAREWVTCAGKVDIRRRNFRNDGYRSPYLDELAAARRAQGIADSAALHPCERLFSDTVSKSGLGLALTADAETLKMPDHNAGAAADIGQDSKRESLRTYFQTYLVSQGFTKSGSRWTQKLGNGLVLKVGIDKSNALRVIQLPIFLEVGEPQSSEALCFSDFDILIPGFRYNAIVLSDDGVSYGLRAHAFLLGEIARSFSNL